MDTLRIGGSSLYIGDGNSLRAGGDARRFSPPDLFANGEAGFWYDPSDLSTVFQDTAGTIPAVSPGDPIGLILDRSGNDIHASQTTLAARPVLARQPLTGRRNLLPTTNPMNWTEIPGEVTRTPDDAFAPDGVTRIPTLTYLGGLGRASIRVDPTVPGATYTTSMKIMLIQPGDVSFYNPVIGGVESIDNLVLGEWVDFSTTKVRAHQAINWQVRLGPGAKIAVWEPQFELSTEPTPYQHVTNASDVTEQGVADCWYILPDLSDDKLEITLPDAIDGEIAIFGTNGSIIEPVSYSAGTVEIGTHTYSGGTDGMLHAIGGIVGVVLIDRTLSQAECDQIISYYKRKGAKGLLVPGPELVVNGDFSDGTNGWSAHPALTRTVEDGRLKLELISSVAHETQQSVPASVGKIYVISCEVESDIGNSAVRARVRFGLGNTFLQATQAGVMETKSRVFLSSASSILVRISVGSNTAYGVTGDIAYFDNISVRELRAEEDW